MNNFIAECIVSFYRFWHGKLHLRGAGKLLSFMAPRVSGLQHYPLMFPNGNSVHVDFRELSAIGCLNALLGDRLQEEALIAAIVCHLNTDSVFWDIGANAGFLSYRISEIQKVKEHHFFEPNSKLYSWAASALANLSGVSGHQIALSDQIGNALLYIPPNRSAYGSLNCIDKSYLETISISTVTGDSLVFDLGFLAPTVIKIDTEGHEVKVLAGMQRLVQEYRPIIFFEHIDVSDSEVANLVPLDYSLKTISNGDGRLTQHFERSAGHNSVLMPSRLNAMIG